MSKKKRATAAAYRVTDGEHLDAFRYTTYVDEDYTNSQRLYNNWIDVVRKNFSYTDASKLEHRKSKKKSHLPEWL
jgi:hypothetical protein